MQSGYPMPNGGYAQDAQQYHLQMMLEAAKTGAIIGGAGAAAAQIHRYRTQGISWEEAARGTVKGAAQVSIAAAAGTAVGSLFNNSTLSLVATLATGTAVMYALNRPQVEAADE